MLEMQSMLQNAPEFYYTTLRDQLRLSLVDILRFTKALKTLWMESVLVFSAEKIQ